MGYVLDTCCCGGICCGCTQDAQGNCADSGPLPATLHVQVTTLCGVFTTTLTRLANNCWQGSVDLICTYRIAGCLPPNNCLACQGPVTLCILLCCGTAFPTVPNSWPIFLTCEAQCANLGSQNNIASAGTYTQSCSPFMVSLKAYPSINNCLTCTDDSFDILITL